MTSWQQPRIDPVDPADKGAFAEFYDVSTASQIHDRPDTFTLPGAEVGRNDILQAPDNDRYDLFVAYDAGVPVAAGQLRRDMTATIAGRWPIGVRPRGSGPGVSDWAQVSGLPHPFALGAGGHGSGRAPVQWWPLERKTKKDG